MKYKKNLQFFLIAVFTVFFLLWYVPATLSLEACSIDEVVVIDSEGNVKTEFNAGENIRYEASLFLNGPGIAVLHGTVTGANWSDSLPLRIHVGRGGTVYNVSWERVLPRNAAGSVRVDITVFSPLRERTIRTAFFSIPPIDADFVGTDVCRSCHPDLYETWSETRHAPGIGCEACHGPGSEHAVTRAPHLISIDTSAELCSKCHSRNNGTVIEAENGFIKQQQQLNEYQATSHGKKLLCSTCHNTHYSLQTSRDEAIKAACNDCHADKVVYLNMQSLDCLDCHMPFAVLKSASDGSGLYREADSRSHIWRINGEVAPEAMFVSSGTALWLDSDGPFLTLNFACLGCHDGKDAVYEDFMAVQQTYPLIH